MKTSRTNDKVEYSGKGFQANQLHSVNDVDNAVENVHNLFPSKSNRFVFSRSNIHRYNTICHNHSERWFPVICANRKSHSI